MTAASPYPDASPTFVAPPMALDAIEAGLAPLGYTRRPRVSLLALIRRPSRVNRLEGLLDRHRWANAGLRERLAKLDEALAAVERVTDATARQLGHAHPTVTAVRAILEEARS